MKTIAILGMGSRGHIYAQHLTALGAKISAICEINENILNGARDQYGVDPNNCFTKEEDFFKKGKLADAIVIATQDRDHFRHCMASIDLGYDMLCEKPVSPVYEECKKISDAVNEKGLLMMVAHVLRYSMYYDKIKQIIDSGEIGDVASYHQVENVGYWHFSHSFVRGNWRNEAETGPTILTKTCHDLDIIYYMTGKKALSVSSFGSRKSFIPENKPEGAPKYCLDGCPADKECPYSVNKIYLKTTRHSIPLLGKGISGKRQITGLANPTKKDFAEALKTSPYGRCVYQCDNDVMDNQVVILNLEDGVNASLVLTAQTNKCYRHIRISGTKGEIIATDNEPYFKVNLFAGRKYRVWFNLAGAGGHVGGDMGICKDFLYLLETGKTTPRLSLMSQTMESHTNAFAAEVSRKTGRTVVLAEEFKR